MVPTTRGNMTGKTVLITGANKSIGFETARALGRLGYHVWLGSRDERRGALAADALRSEQLVVRLLTIDVTDDDSVRAAFKTVEAADGKLDVLINNAGILGARENPGEQALSDIENVYQTNVFAPIRVTQVFCLCLRPQEMQTLSWSVADLDLSPGFPIRHTRTTRPIYWAITVPKRLSTQLRSLS